MARTTRNEDTAVVTRRPVGPMTVFAILQPGADVAAVKAAIAKVTTNRGELFELMKEGAGTTFIPFTVHRAKRAARAE